ncbi:MAG: AMIN domain-containing protein, partial [Azoarcus sp.]|nr:AMIN domain-containing protein [Azoarcus sp.]
MNKRIGALLLSAAAVGMFVPAITAWAQASDPPLASPGAYLNSIQALEVAEDGSTVFVRLTTQTPLAAIPASFTVANPPRIAFDFPATANGLGRGVQSIERGDLRSANIVQAGDRTRLVLNLARLPSYHIGIEGNTVTIALASGGAPAAASSSGTPAFSRVGAPASISPAVASAAAGQSISDINFRRGAGGEGRIIVQLSRADIGIDVRQQGGKLLVSFPGTVLPDNLRRRSDVTDFGTPVTHLQAEQQGGNARLTVTPSGLWEHNAYQSNDQ